MRGLHHTMVHFRMLLFELQDAQLERLWAPGKESVPFSTSSFCRAARELAAGKLLPLRLRSVALADKWELVPVHTGPVGPVTVKHIKAVQAVLAAAHMPASRDDACQQIVWGRKMPADRDEYEKARGRVADMDNNVRAMALVIRLGSKRKLRTTSG